VGTIEIIEVLPFLELLIEESGVVNHDAFELAIELLIIDPVTSLDFLVEPRRGGSDVDVSNALVEHVIVERPLKFGTVVRLDLLDLEGQTFEQVVRELDGRLLVVLGVDAKHPHPHPRAVVGCGVLVVTLPKTR
jgi:hypothetical protein